MCIQRAAYYFVSYIDTVGLAGTSTRVSRPANEKVHVVTKDQQI